MGAPGGEVAVTSGPSRGRNVLLSCLAGCGALALLAVSTCAGFIWWVNRPGELLEPARLRGPETTAYLEWTLRLEDPGTAAFVQSLLGSMQRLQQRAPGVMPGPLGGMLASYQTRRNEKELRKLFPAVVAWTVLSAPDAQHEQHLVSVSLAALGNRTVVADWFLGFLLGNDRDTEIVEHAGEKIYRLKRYDSAFFLRRGQVFFTTGLEGATLAVDRLSSGTLPSAEPTPLDRLIASLPAERALRGATTNEHGEVLRLLDVLLDRDHEDAMARLGLDTVRAATLAGGFDEGSKFRATLDVLGPDLSAVEAGPERLAAALAQSLSTASLPVEVQGAALEGGVRFEFRVDDLPGLLERLMDRAGSRLSELPLERK